MQIAGVTVVAVYSRTTYKEGKIGVCGIGQFFMQYCGNFNLELRYCGILQTCGTRFLGGLVDDSWFKKMYPSHFLTIFSHFWSLRKQPETALFYRTF